MEGVLGLTVVNALSLRHRVEKCVYSDDGKRMAACLGDFSVRVYGIADGACDYESSAHADKPGSPAPNPTLQNPFVLKGHGSNVWSINFSHDSLLLCSSSSDKTVRVWHLEKQENIFTFIQHTDIVWCCSFVPCHPNLVASGSSDKTVKIWDYITGEVLHDLNSYSDAVETLSLSRDGTRLCTGSRDGRVVVWSNIFKNEDEAPAHLVLYQMDKWIRCVRFSEFDSNLLITSGGSNAVLVWDLNDATSVRDNVATQDLAEVVTNSASCSERKTVQFVETNIETGTQPKLELQGHLNTVWDACFAVSNEANIVISCSGDRSLR